MSRVPVLCTFACLSLGFLSVSSQGREAEDDETISRLNTGVLKFAQDHVGKKLGNGECTVLAIRALTSVGAKTTHDYGVSGLDKDYEWGTRVKHFTDAKPGDIVQFRDVVTITKTVIKTGRGSITHTSMRDYDHHTAIISRNLGKGKFKIYEQNAGGPDATEAEKKKVREDDLDLAGKKQGSVWIYRPVKK